MTTMDTNNSPGNHGPARRALVSDGDLPAWRESRGGWVHSRGPPVHAKTESRKVPAMPSDSAQSAQPTRRAPSAGQLKIDGRQSGRSADREAQSGSEESELLASIGNIYYDAQQYPIAVDYYGRALQINPSDAAVRTDMATAYWYLGNADTAITSSIRRSLMRQPIRTRFSTLDWSSGKASTTAPAPSPTGKNCWPPIPTTKAKDKVEQMLSDVEKQAAAKPGAKG